MFAPPTFNQTHLAGMHLVGLPVVLLLESSGGVCALLYYITRGVLIGFVLPIYPK